MNDGDGLDRIFARKVAVMAWIAGPIAYAGSLLWFPDYWAVGTGIVFVLVTGLFTTKIILALENPWAAFGLAPFIGGCWLGLLWLLFRFAG